MAHRDQFKGQKLKDVFPSSLGYYFEKIGESIHHHYNDFGAMHVQLVAETIEEFKKALDKRGLLNAYDTLQYSFELIGYPLTELQKYFEKREESKLNDKDAYIFFWFIKNEADQLIHMAGEIDEEYNSEV